MKKLSIKESAAILLIGVLLISISGCRKKEIGPIPVTAINSSIEMDTTRRQDRDFYIDCHWIGDTLQCKTAFVLIAQNDTIKRIEAKLDDRDLYIWIETSPNDFDCIISGKCRMYPASIGFDLLKIPPSAYRVHISFMGKRWPIAIKPTDGRYMNPYFKH